MSKEKNIKVSSETYEKLVDAKDKTGVPMKKTVDFAVNEYLSKRKGVKK